MRRHRGVSVETSAERMEALNSPQQTICYVEAIPNTNEMVLTKMVNGKEKLVMIQYSKRYLIDKTTPEERRK